MYFVRVFHRAHGPKAQPCGSGSWLYGQFAEIGHWLDDCGYIDDDYRVEITFVNPN